MIVYKLTVCRHDEITTDVYLYLYYILQFVVESELLIYFCCFVRIILAILCSLLCVSVFYNISSSILKASQKITCQTPHAKCLESLAIIGPNNQ